MVPETDVFWSYGVEFSSIDKPALIHGTFRELEKKYLKVMSEI